MTTRKSPRGGNPGASPQNNAGSEVVFSVPDAADEYARHVDGAFIAVVRVAGGRYRRRSFFTLKAAENAVRNARARGQSAKIVFAELRSGFIVSRAAQPELYAEPTNEDGPGRSAKTNRGLTHSSDTTREGLA